MFRPNLQNEEHRRAWEILQTVPEGQKNAFLVQVILENASEKNWKQFCAGYCGKNSKLCLPSPYHSRKKPFRRR